MEVYLDNSATTAVCPQVADLMYKIMTEDYGNPSSMHQKGIVAEKYLRHAKEIFSGSAPLVERNGEKNCVLAIREIEEDKLIAEDLKNSLINTYQKFAENRFENDFEAQGDTELLQEIKEELNS